LTTVQAWHTEVMAWVATVWDRSAPLDDHRSIVSLSRGAVLSFKAQGEEAGGLIMRSLQQGFRWRKQVSSGEISVDEVGGGSGTALTELNLRPPRSR
jgi:hypothetical protein